MVRQRPATTTCLLVAAVLGVLAKTMYRTGIVSGGVRDYFDLSGVLPNFFWAAFLTLVFSLWMSARWAVGTSLGGNILYELDQLRSGGFEDALIPSIGRTFDPWDIMAAVAGVACAYLIIRTELRRVQSRHRAASADEAPE